MPKRERSDPEEKHELSGYEHLDGRDPESTEEEIFSRLQTAPDSGPIAEDAADPDPDTSSDP